MRRPSSPIGAGGATNVLVLLALVGGAIAPNAVLWAGHESVADCVLGSAPTPRSPVHHVFFLIKENHSFENFFATYPGVVGNPPRGNFSPAAKSPAMLHPFALTSGSTTDLPHDRESDLADLDGGLNDAFVATAASESYGSPSDAIGYYTGAQIPGYFDYARNYTLADEFFSGVLGPTLPNRLFDLGLTGTTWSSDSLPPESAVAGPTFPGQLEAAHLPWDYFYSGTTIGLPPLAVPSIADDPCLNSHIVPVSQLAAALAGPAPPAVAYIDPENDPVFSEHPPANVTLGMEWTAAVVNTIFSSPIGSSSVIFLFYDENGGFWDPVAPPDRSPLGDGFRVPLLVLSPWSGGGVVSDLRMDPASLIKFAEGNWGLPDLTPEVANSTSATGLFDFDSPPRAPLELPTPVRIDAAS